MTNTSQTINSPEEQRAFARCFALCCLSFECSRSWNPVVPECQAHGTVTVNEQPLCLSLTIESSHPTTSSQTWS